MRVIVWGINYEPELTGIAPFNTGLCDHLRSLGHDVRMVTTFPYYPSWRKIPGDRGRLFRTDDFDGVPIHRCWHYVPRRVTTLKRIWHELSFGLTSFYRILRLSAPDVYVIVSPPLILGPLAALAGRLKRRPYVFHVQDLQPDAAGGLAMIKPGRFVQFLYRIEAFAYRHAALVSGISDGMIRAFTRKGVPPAKQVLFPNWIRWYGQNDGILESEDSRTERAQAFRKKFQIPDEVLLASYSGNLGRKQGLETLVEAAALLAGRTGYAARPPQSTPPRRDLLILIVGEGAMREALEARIAALGLHNVRLLPLMVEHDYHGMLAASDLALILQAPGTGQFFFPSKLLSVLSVGTPVLSVADGDSELAKAVMEGRFGLNVPPAAPRSLADALSSLSADPARLAAMRQNTSWVQRYSAPRVLGDFEQKLLGLTGKNRSA